MTHAQRCAGAAAAAAALLLPPAPAAAPRASVRVDVSVTNGAGSVRGLSAADFELVVDGKPKPFDTFTAPPASLAMVLLLDLTASMAAYTDADDLAEGFAGALAPGDKAAAGGFASRIQIASRFGETSRDVLAGARQAFRFKKEEKFGPSPIWDALDAAAATLEAQTGRRGIILVTDGRATGNRIGWQAALQRAAAAGTTVYVLTEARPLLIRQGTESAARVRSGLMLQELARLTGGLIVPDQENAGPQLPRPKPVIAQFVDDLRSMYTLGFSPGDAAGGSLRVEVRVKPPGFAVRVRRAYRS